METKRQRQVAETVKRNISLVLQQQGSYIYGAKPLVTVTGVKMSSDLGLARIYVSIWNTDDKELVISQMSAETVSLRQALGQRVRRQLRRIPEIAFYEDKTLDEMFKVDTLFDRLYDEDQMGEKEKKKEEE